MRKKSPPIYTLPHGIEVVGEYAPSKRVPYWRVRIRPHPFFSAPVISSGMYVRRSRVVMASHLGRGLSPKEHVHHKSEDRNDDSLENLELLGSVEHNAHHKTGSKHSQESKERISKGLKLAHAEGRHANPFKKTVPNDKEKQ